MKIKNIMITGLMLAAAGAFADTAAQTNNNVNVQTTAMSLTKLRMPFQMYMKKQNIQ